MFDVVLVSEGDRLSWRMKCAEGKTENNPACGNQGAPVVAVGATDDEGWILLPHDRGSLPYRGRRRVKISVLRTKNGGLRRERTRHYYQLLYAVFSIGDTLSEADFTSVIPEPACSGVSTTDSTFGTQSLALVIGSTGMARM